MNYLGSPNFPSEAAEDGDIAESGAEQVTATEMTRNFRHWQERARSCPIAITHHGSPRSYLVSATHYRQMGGSGGGGKQANAGALRFAIDQIGEHLVVVDDRWDVQLVNSAAEAHLGQSQAALIGRNFFTTFPELCNSYTADRMREAQEARTMIEFEAPSSVSPGRTMSFRLFPFGKGLAIRVRDISEQARYRRYFAERESTYAALAAHGGVALGRINMRGRFEDFIASTTELLGVREDGLFGMRFADIFPTERRVEANDAVEAALGGKPLAIDTEILKAGMGKVRVRLALAPTYSTMAIESATFVITPAA
ncbi:PAS domain-containing protein [Parasphingopyxis marina]|uniref:PAS domain-containing protein n=1 Tax=Parasphingopyxis marina TaxID=2761622 RepID=A0A842HVT2_9SPHN|nr:PAS domain-containing protein [Parasphingopyxis marina]MBC2776537.1 PAS domain-containing protein [Parasphingopyxis marina]